MQCEQSINLHDREVITEQDERRHVDNMARLMPQMWEQFERPRYRQPDNVTENNIPTKVAHK